MPTYPTPPAAYSRAKSEEISSDPNYVAGTLITQTVTFSGTTNKWTFIGQAIHVDQLDTLATAMEKLFYQDFGALKSEDLKKDVDAVPDPLGGPDLAAEFQVELLQVNDQPGSWLIGNSTCTLALGWALRKMIREDLHIGTPYVPPT